MLGFGWCVSLCERPVGKLPSSTGLAELRALWVCWFGSAWRLSSSPLCVCRSGCVYIYIYIYISVCVCVWGSVGVWVVLGMCVCGGLGNACIKPVDGQLHISVGSLVISDISAYHESWLFTSFPGRRGDRVPFHLRGLQIDLRGSPSHL